MIFVNDFCQYFRNQDFCYDFIRIHLSYIILYDDKTIHINGKTIHISDKHRVTNQFKVDVAIINKLN